MTNLINCGTCGYPLTPEERTSLIERDGVMVKPAPMTKDEAISTERALDLALETLESIQAAYPCETVGKRITAIKQARSAPVSMTSESAQGVEQDERVFARIAAMKKPPAAQRQWVGLTDEGRKAIYDECQGLDVMKAIIQTEAKLKEKNT